MRLRRNHAGVDASTIDERIMPLINIVFLLLIFFIVAGVISPARPFDVTPPASRAEPVAQMDALLIYADSEGRFAVGQNVVSLDALALTVSAQLAETPDRHVRLVADADADAREILDVLGGLREAGVKRVRLTTRMRETP